MAFNDLDNDAYREGENAYYNGVPLEYNYHPIGSLQSYSWREGWLDAEEDDAMGDYDEYAHYYEDEHLEVADGRH